MASIYVPSIAACGTHPFCFSPSATFKPHGGKQPPPHHRPPIPPPFFFFSVPNAAEKEEADASEPAVVLLSLFIKPSLPLLKPFFLPRDRSSRYAFSVRKVRSTPNTSLPSARPPHFFRKRFNRTRDLTSQKVFICLLRENKLLGDRACSPHKTPRLFIIANIEPTLPATSSFVISPAPTDLFFLIHLSLLSQHTSPMPSTLR